MKPTLSLILILVVLQSMLSAAFFVAHTVTRRSTSVPIIIHGRGGCGCDSGSRSHNRCRSWTHTKLFGYLDEINEQSSSAGPPWNESVVTDPNELFDEYMLKVEAAFSRVQHKMGTMQVNEKRSHKAVQAVQERMKEQEEELTNRLEHEVENVRMEAERERQEAIDRHRAREERLEIDTKNLIQQLESEKRNMEANEELIREAEAKRVALDDEVSMLKQQFSAESDNLSAKYIAEQERRKKEVAEAQRMVQEWQDSARTLGDQTEKRILELQEQLSIKENEKEDAILSIKTEMDAREQALTIELETIKASYQQRETELRSETEELGRKLEEEKEKIRANQAMTANLVSRRVALDTELGELRRLYEDESKQWDAKYAHQQESRRTELTRAQDEILQLQASAESTMAELEKGKASLSEKLAMKELQMQTAIISIKDQLHAKEKEFKEITNQLGVQITKAKIHANLRDMALSGEAKEREILLQKEMEELLKLVETERKSLRVNQELTNRILSQRVAIDAELGELKRRFDQDSKRWDSKYAKEQEKRRLEVMRSKRQLLQLEDAAEVALRAAWERQENLTSQLATKEKEKQAILVELRDEIKAKEKEFRDVIADMGMQMTRAKIEANMKEMKLKSAAQAREAQLQKEIDELRKRLLEKTV